MGCPEEEIASGLEQEQIAFTQAYGTWRLEMEQHQVLVWPENWRAVEIFQSLAGDWITPGMMGGGYRLPTTEIESAMRICKVKNKLECWRKIQIMKAWAASILMQKLEDSRNGA